jgi:hypothetical protein
MTHFLIDKTLYATDFTASVGSCWGNIYTYRFRIDVKGNVFVKWGQADFRDPQPEATDVLFSVVDNIKVSSPIIDLYLHLFKHVEQGPGNGACRLDKMQMLFETVKHMKVVQQKQIQCVANEWENPF